MRVTSTFDPVAIPALSGEMARSPRILHLVPAAGRLVLQGLHTPDIVCELPITTALVDNQHMRVLHQLQQRHPDHVELA